MAGLLLELVVFLVVLGVVYYLAGLVLPHPFPTIVLVVGILILLIWLVDLAGSGEFAADVVALLPLRLLRR